ncbi:cupin domain-containing protein [Reyranella sp. CPCC 100927]|uniref:cupin domain-containing protein n=1 Tax=Reyranella sp. CPCC 100927 TaxID=2599616 RepID=UPI0011B5A8CE|nr:cupin domain-containing protein [Reyranella sp. CPCC 100927]TWT08769.1 cupin domain-containing protein [Reyranella sp. CPCC 100927]
MSTQSTRIDPITNETVSAEKGAPLTAAHQAMRVEHPDDHDWTLLRYEGQTSKMLFHPTADDPTVPNAGLVHYEPGSSHPVHSHYFAQIWYVLDGEFRIGGKTYGKGTMIFHPDPHFEHDLVTDTGGTILYVQYMGPSTRQAPIYDGRFNVTRRKKLEDETTEY